MHAASTRHLNRPLVTIVVVCCNQAPYVVECLESIRQQTYDNIELIIVDDCSQDDSVSTISEWLETTGVRATFIEHPENRGICRTFNEAVARAHGSYVSIVAADDVYLPDKTEAQVAMLERLPGTVGVVYSDAWQIDQHGNLLSAKFIGSHRSFETMPEGKLFPILLEGNFIPAMATLIRRACFETVGFYDENLAYEDYDMWLRLARQYEFVFLPGISVKYRVVPTSATRTILKSGGEGLRSDFRTYEKFLRARDLNSEERARVKLRLTFVGYEMYARNFAARRYYLAKLFQYNPRGYTLVMLLFVMAGIPFRYFSALLRRAG